MCSLIDTQLNSNCICCICMGETLWCIVTISSSILSFSFPFSRFLSLLLASSSSCFLCLPLASSRFLSLIPPVSVYFSPHPPLSHFFSIALYLDSPFFFTWEETHTRLLFAPGISPSHLLSFVIPIFLFPISRLHFCDNIGILAIYRYNILQTNPQQKTLIWFSNQPFGCYYVHCKCNLWSATHTQKFIVKFNTKCN